MESKKLIDFKNRSKNLLLNSTLRLQDSLGKLLEQIVITILLKQLLKAGTMKELKAKKKKPVLMLRVQLVLTSSLTS